MKYLDEIYLLIRPFAGGSTKVVCHVEVNEHDPITQSPCKIFRQHIDVITHGNVDDFTSKKAIVKGIIEGFQQILETMKRDRKYENSN